MAPVGRSALSGKNPFSNNESCTQILREDEIKQEPSDEDVFHNGFLEVVPVKNKVTLLYGAMNNDEGVVIKQEDTSEDEEKPDVNALDDDIIAESDRRNYAANNPSLLDDVGDSSKLLCKVCGKQFFRVYYFNLHMKTHKSSSTTSHQDLEKPHKCHECGKSFAFLQHLTGHSRIHIAGQYYECPICRRKFTEFSNLSMHLLKTHPDEKPYKCSECGKQFTQSSALKKHFRTHSSHISQEELDRIDMMFFVSDDGRRDFEEPLKKKIKLEIEEDKISPHKEKSPTKDAVAQSKLKSPCKETFTSLKVKLSEKEKVSQPIERNLVKSHTAVSVKNEHEPVVEVAFKENETGLSLPLRLSPKFGVSPSAKEMSSKTLLSVHHESSVSFNNPAVATEPPSLDDSAVLSEDNSILFQSKAKSPKDSPIISHCKESLPLRNGVPLDQVKCPQIKVVKFPKAALESEPLSVKGQTFYSPLKSITGSNQTNFESVELMEETENSNQSIMCNGDRIQKGRPAPLFSLSRSKSDLFVGWERNKSDHRDPLPSLEEPEGEYEAKYKCHRCEIFLDSEEKLHDHLMDHTGVKLSECRFCGKDFTTLTSLKRHLYYHVAGLIPQDCLRCGKTFPTFKDLKEHCTSEECDASNSARYKCFRCRKEMPSLKKLKVHLLSQCNDEPAKFYFPKKNDSSLSPTSNVRAMDQNKSHEDISDSDRQVYSESDIKALKCDPKDEEALMILCEMEPEKGKECWNLECQTCGHKFENTVKAKVHTEVGCGLQSKSSDAQDKTEGDAYKIKVSFEEDENLQCFLNCAECGAKILGVEKMLLHIQEHIFEQNNLTCPVLKCGKLFKDPKEFKLHLKAHTGHKPFKCSDCGKRFFLRENYEHHAQRHGILKHWSSVSTIFGDNAGKKSIVARSPITIESSIINLEVSEADVERKAQSAQHETAKALERIKEEVNEEVDDWQPRKKMKVPVSRSSTVNRQSLPFKRKTVPNFNKSSQPLKKPSHPPSKPTEPLIRPAQATNRLTQPVNKPSSPSNRPTSSVSALLSVSKPTPVNKPSSVSESSLPVHKSPTLLNQTSSIINRLSPPVVKSSPTLNRPLIPIIRASPSIEIPTTIVSRLPQSIGSPIVNRIISGHPASGSVSVTPQGIFTVSAPRTYLASSSGSCSKPSFSLSSNRTSLSQKDPNARVHPSSYYCITENSRASIQASNRELRKYPRSGVCEICKKICSRLDKHMMVHLNQKPHLCPVCPQAFRQSEHLRRHIRARHEGNHRQFECPQCEKRLTRKDKLKEHMKNCSRMLANSPLVTGPYLGDNLFNMIPGPAHLSHSNLQGHTTA